MMCRLRPEPATGQWLSKSDSFHVTLDSRCRPDIIPCPLGTGNDLARILGWGVNFPGIDKLGKQPKRGAAVHRRRVHGVWASYPFLSSNR